MTVFSQYHIDPQFNYTTVLVPPSYQRNFEEERAQSIADRFDPNEFDPIKVSVRSEGEDKGRSFVVDGQHRLWVAKHLGATHGPAVIVHLSEAEEAKLFAKGNGSDSRKNVSQPQRFIAGLVAGDQDNLVIRDVLKNFGFEISHSKGEGKITAVGSIKTIYAKYGREGLENTLALATEIWATDPKVIDGGFLGGLALFIDKYGDRIDETAKANLESQPIVKVLRNADGHQQSTRRTRAAAELRVLAKIRKKTDVKW